MESPVQGEIGDRDETTNYRGDVTVNEAIETESSDEESGLVEVETVNMEDMFNFCMDQIANASTREERQEARDWIADNFGEMNLHELDLDVIVDKGNKAIVGPEQPSTSQAGSSQVKQNSTQTRTKRKFSQQQLDKFRTYWEQLKTNQTKYQNTLKRMRLYQKQRRELMTEDEKKECRRRGREAYHKCRNNLSAEKKREMNQKRCQRQKSSRLNKFVCKFTGCSKTFVYDKDLIKHERIHLDIKPFICTWPSCQYTSKNRSDVILHIRTKHFKLPRTKQQQQTLNIIDNRNPNDYVQVNNEMANRRLE